MTERAERRLATLRAKLADRTIMDHAPTRPIVTITAVRDLGNGGAVLDYIDHTRPENPTATYEIGLDDVPDEDDESLAEIYLENLIEDLLSVE